MRHALNALYRITVLVRERPLMLSYAGQQVRTFALVTLTLLSCTQGSLGDLVAFDYTGSDQFFTVPAGVTTVTVKLWGAGGGAAPIGLEEFGGPGGFTTSTLATTPGEILTFIIGQGGSGLTLTGTYGGGGAGASDVGASGGGRSAVRRGGTELLTAGGGGGDAAPAADGFFYGGPGGGLSGIAGEPSQFFFGSEGGGGTQTSGGTAGDGSAPSSTIGSPGTAFAGGAGNAGGGGGYFGGGGGTAGGGGSGYIGAGIGGFTEAGTLFGLPPQTSDADYIAGIGIGGTGDTFGAGGNGRAVLSFAAIPEPSAFLCGGLVMTAFVVRLEMRRRKGTPDFPRL